MSKTVDFSTQLIIGGRPLPGSEGKTFETINLNFYKIVMFF